MSLDRLSENMYRLGKSSLLLYYVPNFVATETSFHGCVMPILFRSSPTKICLIQHSLIPLKHVSNLEVIELSGNVYDVFFVVVPGIWVGPCVQQDLDHVDLPEHGGQMKRGPAVT